MALLKKTSSMFIVLLSLSLSGCSTVSGWFNEDDAPEAVGQLLDNKNVKQDWYCYGKKDGSDWQCGNETKTELITAIDQRRYGAEVEAEDSVAAYPAIAPTQPLNKAQSDTKQPSAKDSAESEQPLLSYPENYYAVQILALQEENGLVNYAKRNGISEPMYVKMRSRDENWYVLLLGVYEDRAAANKAKDTWEKAKSLKAKPWIRRLGPLQEAIRAAEQG